IYVDALSSSSIDMGIRVYTRTENYWTAKWSFTESIKKAFDANGIKIPFNQMDVHISQTD
ncbi:MAG: mechanosensitive ion channel family protein, partial [Lachnospiraceae bacterium]|nr:mechanosensitive ion channel family protein [Lachnospiraceae bacterium]